MRLLEAVLTPQGYDVVTASTGLAALEAVDSSRPDLILLDVTMPGLDGYAVCRRLRESDHTALPVIMVTSSIGEERARAIDAGADDFIPKPFNHDELLARVRSLVRIKRYHDTIEAQAAEIATLRRLRRFLSTSATDAVVADERLLEGRRRHVAVVFAGLQGWESLADAIEPEELLHVLDQFYDAVGTSVERFEATVGFLGGAGVQLFFNAPLPIPDAPLRAVQLACALREQTAELLLRWRKRGYDLDFASGLALGYAACGEVGFEGRSGYAAVGAVTTLASRLAEEAEGGQILVAQRLYTEVENAVEVEPAREFTLKGFQRPIAAFNVLAAL